MPGLLPRSYQGDSRGAEIFAKLGVHHQYIPTKSDTD